MGIRPLTNSYYCTAVWLQLNNLTFAQFSRPLGETVHQCSGRDRPIQLHIRNKLLANVIELQTQASQATQATSPAGLQDTHSERNQNGKRTSAQQLSEPRNAGNKHSRGPVQRYCGTNNQMHIANTHSIPDADPSMMSNTHEHILSVTLNAPCRHLKNSASFPLSPVPLSDFLLLLI